MPDLPRPHVLRALVRRDWRILRSYRSAFVSDIVFGFLTLVIYYFVSRTLKPNLHAHLSGAPNYFAFAVGGVALSVVLQAATTGITRRIREEQLTGTLEMLVVQPIASFEIALGIAGFPCFFAVTRAILYLLLAAGLLGLSLAHASAIAMIVAILVSSVAFSAIGVTLAAVVLVFRRSETLASAGTMAMTMLGGSVFPTQSLSSWLQPISDVMPTRYAFEALRAAQFGGDWIGPTLILAAFIVVTLPLALCIFSGALALNIKRGTLHQY